MQFTSKYKPKRTSEVVGQDEQLRDIKKGVSEYGTKRTKKALLLYGPSGTGKTSTVHALANELDLEIIEVNASDSRNTESLENKILPAIKQQSLFGRGKIILIDEIDGISGNQDRGGVPSIVKFIEESTFPIILTANDPFDQKFNPIRQKSIMIEYKAISLITMVAQLKKICEKEGIKFEEDALTTLSRKNQGDMRAALNDLENVSTLKKIIKKEDVEDTSEREREDTIINALLKIFKTKDPSIALRAFENIDEDIDKIFLWIDENLTKEYTDIEDVANAYEQLSQADIYYGRIRRWQYYRFYVYIYDLLSAGIALSKKERNKTMIEYKPTSRILKIWMANQKNARKKTIAAKIKTHGSNKKAYQDLAYIRIMMKEKKLSEKIAKEYKLEKEEIEWLKK
ncbi:MAG: replication factor C large subunit [Candidatus Woesearchaeota archaeon]